MAFNRFNILVIIQILLIAGMSMLFALTVQKDFMQMTSAGLMIIWIGQILFLAHYMSRIHRDVDRFMEGLKNQDTTQHFNLSKGGKYFRSLYNSFEEISRNFRLVRIEKETENQFFREVICQSAWGIMASGEDGKTRLINDAALQLLGLKQLRNLEDLSSAHPGFLEILGGDTGMTGFNVKILADDKLKQLAVKSTAVKMFGDQVRIFFLSDISREMAWNEVEAWQKLIRVLNHEITNSVSPIHILSTSLYELFHRGKTKKSPGEIDEALIERTILGLDTIVKRSNGLSKFIKDFRNFTHTGNPEYNTVQVQDLLHRVKILMSEEFAGSQASFSVEVTPRDMVILADEKLVEQSLINLVRNALQATVEERQPVINLRGFREGDQVCLAVTDNGKGIPEEIIDHVFTPFFTTRKEGSGIGLSMVRQVMPMHKGSISVSSEEGKQTSFTMTF
jgi:two-component system nitrogen regulation sensor histidine kinase NtrY